MREVNGVRIRTSPIIFDDGTGPGLGFGKIMESILKGQGSGKKAHMRVPFGGAALGYGQRAVF